MADRYTNAQKNIVNSDNRNMAANGIAMADEINSIWSAIDTGPVGITSDPVDIDSIAKGGGAFGYDPDTSSGLSFGYRAGRINWIAAVVTYAPGAITLSASNTNYVEADRDGTIHSNTAGFTSTRAPLYTVVCGVSTITTVTQSKLLMTFVAPGGIGTSLLAANSVTGAILSVVGATRTENVKLAAISATASFLPIVAPVTGVVSAASLYGDTVVASDNTDYWTFSITNLGQANAGSQAILAATAPNTTKATGGSAMAVNVPFPLALAGTSLAVIKGDVLIVTATKTAAATTIDNLHASIDFSFTN